MNVQKTNQRINIMILMGLLTLPLILANLFAQPEETALQTDLDDLEVGGQWSYGDLEKGVTLALESGKPLFVLFR